MCILSSLSFPLEKYLNLPPLGTSYIKCVLFNEECCLNQSQGSFFKDLTFPFATTSLAEVPVSSATVLCEDDDVKTVIEILFDISELSWKYLPGDTIGIFPKNNEGEVEVLMNRLGLNSDESYKIEVEETKKKALPAHIPPFGTVKFLFESCLDFRAVVKKAFLRALAEHTSDPIEKRRIMELCSREGAGEYNEHILKPKSSILDVLQVFPSCKPPLTLLLEHIPRLQPRPYSIASSPLQDPDKLRIVFNVVHDSRNRRGICSGWLYEISRPLHDLNYKFSQVELSKSMKPSNVKVFLYLREPSNFRIPENTSLPLIMIGPGTGVAPFIGFLEHRRQQLSCNNENRTDNWVIFGCRHKNKDEIFKKMFLAMEKESLCSYHVSYSREKNSSEKYVQDIMRLNQNELVNQLTMTKTVIFICGNGVTVTKDIMETLVHLIAMVKGISEQEAKDLTVTLEKNGQIVKELWN